ncbi:hypothetical protein ACA910_000350 [Epithemia clementina (nom. ined.)]
MLKVLKDKDTFNVLSTQAPPFGVVAENINDEIKENLKQKAQPAKRFVLDNEDGDGNPTKKQKFKVVREDELITKSKQASGGGGKAHTPKQMVGSATKKTISKATSTPSKLPAKQMLTTTKKTNGAKQSGGGMSKSPHRRAKETGKYKIHYQSGLGQQKQMQMKKTQEIFRIYILSVIKSRFNNHNEIEIQKQQ